MRRGADYTLSMETPPSPFPGDGEGAAASGEAPDGTGYPPKFAKEGLTFDDVLLLPAESNVLPNEVSTAARLTPKIQLSIPIVSAAMDTVTEAPLAIAMARQGGIGIVHRNLSVDEQVTEVDRVKRSQSGMITDPVTLPPDAPVRAALDLMARYKISGVPIVDGGGKLVGILTNRDLRFVEDHDQIIERVMKAAPLVTAPVGTTLEQAKDILWQHRIEKLPDRRRRRRAPRASSRSRTSRSRPSTPSPPRTSRAGSGSAPPSASGPTPSSGPRPSSPSGVDLLVVDTSHGHSQGVLDVVKTIKGGFDIEVIGGNVVTADAVDAMAAAGADGVKVGVGPGIDLHHPGGRRGGRAADHGHPRLRGRRQAARHHARSPTAASSSRATSPRRWPPAPTSSCSARCSPASTSRRARSCCTRASASRSTGAWARWAP